MSLFHSNALIGAAGQSAGGGGGGYEISRSVRFNSSDSAYLSRTPASAGNRKTWTWAGWVKKCKSIRGVLFGGGTTQIDAEFTSIEFESDDTLRVLGWNTLWAKSNAVYRDYSAWMHVLVSFDSTQSSASNQIKVYVNGAQISKATENALSQNTDYGVNQAVRHTIGAISEDANPKNDFYLADVHFIDGQALDPTSFGEFDANGIWQPKAYSGSYGTNGFHLPFSNNSSSAALGTDTSGQGNTWTVNNISVTAGAGNDSLVDSPTNITTDNDTGAGGEVRGNYCTLNPLSKGEQITLSNGNLDWSASSTTPAWATRYSFSSIGVSSGKWYAELTITDIGTSQNYVGVITAENIVNLGPSSLGFQSTGWGYYANGNIYNNGSIIDSSPASYTTGDVIGIALDVDNRTVAFYKNGVQQGSTATSLTSDKTWVFAANSYSTSAQSWNFGQRPFAYTAPSGFKALCTTNLPEPTGVVAQPNTAMDVALYTGNGGSQSITGLSFQPDLVWIKNRSSFTNQTHAWFDVLRGKQMLASSSTNGEAQWQGANGLPYRGYVDSFDSNGFSLVPNSQSGLADYVNYNNTTYVAWTWDAGSSTVTNTDGSITSSVRANPSAGFSILTYTGNGSAGATIGHGLGAAPQMIIARSRDTARSWTVGHQGIASDPWTDYLVLNSTVAASDLDTVWNDTAPTSSVFTVGTANRANANNEAFVAYCFAPVDGYSSFGSYTGNGSTDGPFVYTGFRPRWIMIKKIDTADAWNIIDTERGTYNVIGPYLNAEVSSAEANYSGWDILSNGLKLRNTGGSLNTNNGTYIYAAFAEFPFKYARAR